MSEVVSFEPREFTGVTIDRDTAIVTTNHLGADMRGDAGLDAQYLADISGHAVIGMNRIGSGDDARYSKPLARQLTCNPETVTNYWFDTIEPAIRDRSPSRIELVARSAGANLMLHVAALELIPNTTGVLAIEALRLQRVNTRLGQLKYIHYQLRKEGTFKDVIDEQVDADLPPSADERSETAASPRLMLRRQLIDIRHYQHRWASDLPYQNALHIAKNVNITAALLFAEESMAADSDKLPDYLTALTLARCNSGLRRKLCAAIVPHTTHGSFDDQRLYATHYRRFAAMAADDEHEQ